MTKFAYIILIIILSLGFGCKDKLNYEKPPGLISKSQMIDILYDMHLAIGTSNIPNINMEKNRNYMSVVYEKYGIDSVQFAQSNLYYTSHIQDYEEIFEKVEKRLKELRETHQTEMDSIRQLQINGQKAQRITDSVKKVRNLTSKPTPKD